jgi:hypothetical protein
MKMGHRMIARLAAALVLLLCLMGAASAQISCVSATTPVTQSAMDSEIAACLPDNTQNLITPAILRQVLTDLTASAYQGYFNSTGMTPAYGLGSPLFIWANPGSTFASAGTNAGCRIIIGTPASFANPGTTDIIGCTFYIDNLNNRCGGTNGGCWDLNTIVAQQPYNAGVTGGGIMRSEECDVYANIAVADITNPFTAGSATFCHQFVASSNGLPGNTSAVPPTGATWCWSADSTALGTGGNTAPVTWWATCHGLARAIYAGITAVDITGDAASQSFQKAVLWDRSSSAYIIKDGPNPVNTTTPHTGIFDFTQSPGLGIFANQGSNNLLFQAAMSVGLPMLTLKNTTSGGDATIELYAGAVAKAAYGYGGATNSWLVFSNPLNATAFSIDLASGVWSGIIYSAAGTALPTCNATHNGATAVVSDATGPTYRGAYTSGGTAYARVLCVSGTGWITT